MHCKPGVFATAGTKDKRAVTVQHVTAFKVCFPALSSFCVLHVGDCLWSWLSFLLWCWHALEMAEHHATYLPLLNSKHSKVGLCLLARRHTCMYDHRQALYVHEVLKKGLSMDSMLLPYIGHSGATGWAQSSAVQLPGWQL